MGSCDLQIRNWYNKLERNRTEKNRQKIKKMMTMHGALQPKSDVDRLYMKRKEGGRGLSSVEQIVMEEENSLGFYVLNSEEKLMK